MALQDEKSHQPGAPGGGFSGEGESPDVRLGAFVLLSTSARRPDLHPGTDTDTGRAPVILHGDRSMFETRRRVNRLARSDRPRPRRHPPSAPVSRLTNASGPFLDSTGLRPVENPGTRHADACGLPQLLCGTGHYRSGGPFNSIVLPSGSRMYIEGPLPSAP